jgi:hypothetical protein
MLKNYQILLVKFGVLESAFGGSWPTFYLQHNNELSNQWHTGRDLSRVSPVSLVSFLRHENIVVTPLTSSRIPVNHSKKQPENIPALVAAAIASAAEWSGMTSHRSRRSKLLDGCAHLPRIELSGLLVRGKRVLAFGGCLLCSVRTSPVRANSTEHASELSPR